MEEAERLADRIAIIAAGRIIAAGHAADARRPDQLAARDQLHAARAARRRRPAGRRSPSAPSDRDRTARIVAAQPDVAADLHALSGWALDHGLELDDLEVRRPTLEDVYLQLTTHRQ